MQPSQSTKVAWVETSQTGHWKNKKSLTVSGAADGGDVEVNLDKPLQTIEGFGTCFNDLGWTSLNFLSDKDRQSILRKLFAPGVGGNSTICRMSVGANDFSRHWCSYDETDSDFKMKNFSIANDFETLIPFIKNAQQYNPALNGLPKDKEGKEGIGMFIQQEKYCKAYALYFAKFIQAYRDQKINIGMVIPQNEFNSAQPFPGCTWTAAGLAKFISSRPKNAGIGCKCFFGTLERPNVKLVDTILNDPQVVSM